MQDNNNILVLYDQQHSHREVPGSASGRYRFNYCAVGNHFMESISVPEQGYDWLLVEGSLMGGEQKEFVQALRAIDTFFSEGFASGCRVEWTAGGVLQLQCCMQSGQCRSPAAQRREPATEGFVFEYHAPMKQTG